MAELNPVGSELLVNVLTAGDQFDPDVTRLASGGFVVAWASRTTFISARIYGVDGTPTGSEFSVQTNSRSLWEPTLAPTATGGFVNFAWHLTLSTFAIDGVERTATGLPVRDLLGELGSGFTTIPDFPEAASLASGAIVLTYSWGGDVGARFIPLDGSPPGERFIINSTTSGSQRNPEIAGVASGGFVAVWEDNSGAGGDAVGYGIMARTFDGTGASTSAEILVNSETAGDQINATVTALANGFVVVWQDASGAGGDVSGSSIKAQLFDASGNKVGGEILVNTTTTGDQATPVVTALPFDGFVVAWADAGASGGDTSGWAIRAHAFDGSGSKVGDEVLVNTTTAGDQTAPAISLVGDSEVVVTWVDASATGGDTDGTAVRAQLLKFDSSDVQTGTPGDDTFFVDDPEDVIVEAPGNGNDALEASTSYVLAAGVSVETLRTIDPSLTTPIDLAGNEIANAIFGNAGANQLDGGGGNDILSGLDGNDRLLGGEDADQLNGGAGVDQMFGGNGADQLDGGADVDRLEGGNGDDFYVVDNAADVVVEAVGGGSDFVTATANYVLGAGQSVEYLSVAGWGTTFAINLTGNELVNTVYGNAGVNNLDGGGGTDTLVGFGGDDYYLVDNAGDVIVEEAGGGSDFVAASTSYALAAGQSVEYLSVAGWGTTGARNLTGNEFGNTIYGNAGVNNLNGGGGTDTLVGFGGDDYYIVDNAGDVVVEETGGGSDFVASSTSYTLGAGIRVEYLSVAGWRTTGAIDLTGNEVANTLYGNDGANVLDGRGGNDVLVGFAGADRFAFTTALGGGNVDVVADFEAGIDKIALDDALFAGLGPGALPAGAFRTGSAAQDADDRILYDPATGALLFDADGAGAVAAVQFASLTAGLSLGAGDFVVI